MNTQLHGIKQGETTTFPYGITFNVCLVTFTVLAQILPKNYNIIFFLFTNKWQRIIFFTIAFLYSQLFFSLLSRVIFTSVGLEVLVHWNNVWFINVLMILIVDAKNSLQQFTWYSIRIFEKLKLLSYLKWSKHSNPQQYQQKLWKAFCELGDYC